MAEVRWTNRAIEDVEHIARFIAKDSEKYARIQVQRFFKRTMILHDYPEMGRRFPEFADPSVRELILGNYRIIYKLVDPTHVDIVAVHHGRRLLTDIQK